MVIIVLLVIFVSVICLLLYMYKEAFANRVIYHDLEFSTFPEGFGKVKLFFISDIHRRVISDELLNKVKGNVDVVVIGGDLLEKGVTLHRVKENIEKLKVLGPVLFVWGNNDYEVDVPLLDAMLLNLGVKLLVNSSMMFESERGDKLYFIGVDEVSLNRDNLEEAISETEDNSFKILVCHNPEISKKLHPEYGISLLLSGHTHGGQIRLFGFGLYEKGKLVKEKGLTTLISNGYGTTSIPLRLGARSESHLISIQYGIEN